MSELSYLEKLLEGIEVEWFPLGKVAKKIYSGGTPDTKKIEYWEHGTIPWMSSGEVNLKTIKETEKFITEDGLNNSSAKFVPENSIVMALAGQGKTRGKVARTRIKLTTNQSLAAITFDERKINSDYIFHFLETQYDNLRQISSGNSGRGGIGIKKLSSYKFPIPCPDNPEKSLAIQSEIVRVLDKFTALTAELTAELTARKKQYNYYRDQLLSFEEGEVEWKTLGDVTKKWYSGGTPTAGNPEYYDGGDIPWLRTQEIKFSDVCETEVKITAAALKKTSAKWIPENCVIVAISGATAGRSAINKIALTTNQHCGCLEIDSKKALYRYVFHWVSFNYENIKALGQGARGDLNSTIIKNFKLPIPYADDPEKSLEEQARIVAILDKFDTLTGSISEGLPREIELRQKQYEYYRDLLFSFPKPDSVTN